MSIEILIKRLRELAEAETDLKRKGKSIQVLTLIEDIDFNAPPVNGIYSKAETYTAVSEYLKYPQGSESDMLQLIKMFEGLIRNNQ